MVQWIVRPTVWAIAWCAYLLPFRIRRSCAKFIGAILRQTKWRRSVVEKNLLIGYPTDRDTRAELLQTSYQEFGSLLIELLWLFGPLKYYVKKNAHPVHPERIWRQLDAGRKVILLSSHLGNPEVMAAVGALKAGLNLMLVTKRFKPAWLHDWVERCRSKLGYKGAYEPRVMQDIIKHWNAGGVVGFTLDQFAGLPIGVRVPFFGVPVGTAATVATLAVRYDAVVIPVMSHRQPDGSTHIIVDEPVEGQFSPGRLGIAERTAAYVACLERHVRMAPAQWLWVHNRFKEDLSPLRPGEWEQARVRPPKEPTRLPD